MVEPLSVKQVLEHERSVLRDQAVETCLAFYACDFYRFYKEMLEFCYQHGRCSALDEVSK